MVALTGSDQITDPPIASKVDKYSIEGRQPHSLTVLVPCRSRNGTRAYPGKRYQRAEDGSVQATGFNLRDNRLLNAHEAPVSSVVELHDLLLRIQECRLGIVVPGRLRDPARRMAIRRLANDRPDCPATLESVPLPWLLLDLDKVPNIHALDPRMQPGDCRDWLLSLLPRSLRRARCVVRWSSSTCMHGEGPPETLSAHLWFWLDGLLARKEAKSICMAVDAHIRCMLRLPARPRGNGGWLADWKITEPQQPIYVASPLCEDGLVDPFSAEERTVLAGGPDADVVLDDLRTELEQCAGLGLQAGQAPARAARKREGANRPATKAQPSYPEPVARAPLVLPATLLLHRDHALVQEIRGLTMASRKETVGKRAVDSVLGAGRAAAEMVRIALARAVWGRKHEEFGAWAEAGGVPEGERDTWLYSIAACLAHALPGERILDGTLRDLLTRVGEVICGREWTATEWVKDRCDGAVIVKAVQAARGETIVRDGKRWDPRYRWNAAALRRDLGIGADEGDALGLLTLAEGATEKRSRRALVALRKPEPMPDARAGDRAEVLRLRGEGLSLRAISARTGVPVGTVQAWAAKAMPLRGMDAPKGRSVTPSTKLGLTVESFVESSTLVTAATEAPVVHAVEKTAKVVQALPAACPGPRLPSFIVRRLEEKQAAVEKAKAYVSEADALARELSRRGAIAPLAWPVAPPTSRLPDALRLRVEMSVRALGAALASVRRRQDERIRRLETAGERDGFWSACEAVLMREPLEAEEMASGRLVSVKDRWSRRMDAADSRAEASGQEADRVAAGRIRMAGRAVQNAERRRHEALFGFRAAA